jgi:K+-transporting ATPase ATPase C chain
MIALIRPCLSLFILLTLLTGVLYPLVVTVIAQVAFPHQAEGSLVRHAGRVVGSELIGQVFSDPRYLWGRPSATTPACNAASSSGSNLGPTNPDLIKAVGERIAALRQADPSLTGSVPADLVTASGSGLDPDISPEAASVQIRRIATVRGVDPDAIRRIILSHTRDRQLGVLGEPRVNVLAVNLDLDKLGGTAQTPAP